MQAPMPQPQAYPPPGYAPQPGFSGAPLIANNVIKI
jgi:hypothetical protein